MRKFNRSTTGISSVFLIAVFQASLSANPTSYTVIDLSPTTTFTGSGATGVGSGLQVGWGLTADGTNHHALIWSGSAGSFVDLNGSFTGSTLNGISGNQQVGSTIGSSTGGNNHAILWNGTAASAIDLHPTGFISSVGTAISGGQQGGYGYIPFGAGSQSHAILWTGSAASAVDLNPSGYTESAVLAMGGAQQGGYAFDPGTTTRHAMLWTGAAASATDLNPIGFTGSEIYGVGAGLQVGEAIGSSTGNNQHAMLWSGTAAGAIDLHPTGFLSSTALAIGDGIEVGYASSPTLGVGTNAMAWSGTAASAINLKQFLPAQYIYSEATGVDSNGNIVGYGIDSSQNYHAIEWIPAPEPTSLSLLSLGTIALLARKRKSSTPA